MASKPIVSFAFMGLISCLRRAMYVMKGRFFKMAPEIEKRSAKPRLKSKKTSGGLLQGIGGQRRHASFFGGAGLLLSRLYRQGSRLVVRRNICRRRNKRHQDKQARIQSNDRGLQEWQDRHDHHQIHLQIRPQHHR